VIVDLLSRRYAEHLERLPDAEDARAQLAEVVLASSRELSAADLAAVIGGTRLEASHALDRLAEEEKARRRQEADFVLYFRKRGG
jgi:DNA-binding transcriptional ArsR family regulator